MMFQSEKRNRSGQLRKLFCPCCGGSTRTRGLKPETVRVEPRVCRKSVTIDLR